MKRNNKLAKVAALAPPGLPQEYATKAELSQRFRVSTKTVERWRKDGIITGLKTGTKKGRGGKVIFNVAAVTKQIELHFSDAANGK